jgi:hypothetical protein
MSRINNTAPDIIYLNFRLRTNSIHYQNENKKDEFFLKFNSFGWTDYDRTFVNECFRDANRNAEKLHFSNIRFEYKFNNPILIFKATK